MNPFSVNIEGLNDLIKRVDDKAKNLSNEVDAELAATTLEMQSDAKKAAPVDFGKLRSSITSFKAGELAYDVAAQAHYAAYVEFGTGTLVNVPEGLEEYAIQFKGKGVRKVNLPARPFMWPSVRKRVPELIDRISKILVS